MNNPRVKLVPHKKILDVFQPEFVSFDGKELLLTFENMDFAQGDTFDAILEEGNQLKFLKAVLKQTSEAQNYFEIVAARDAIKREYERISMILDVTSPDFTAQTLNISAGGMQIRSEQELEPNNTYLAQIKYESKNIPVQYEILRVKKDKNKFMISGKFVDLDKDDKAFIMQQNLKNKIFSLKSLPIRQEGEQNG